MDLDAMLDEAAEATFKQPEQLVQRKKMDPPEIKPYLAATALVQPNLRDKWTDFIRRDNAIPNKPCFLASNAYQAGDPTNIPASSNRILFELVKQTAEKSGLNDAKASKLAAMVNPATDNEVGKRLQAAYKRYMIESLRKDIESDVNFDPAKFKSLATLIAKQ